MHICVPYVSTSHTVCNILVSIFMVLYFKLCHFSAYQPQSLRYRISIFKSSFRVWKIQISFLRLATKESFWFLQHISLAFSFFPPKWARTHLSKWKLVMYIQEPLLGDMSYIRCNLVHHKPKGFELWNLKNFQITLISSSISTWCPFPPLM